MQTIQKVTFVFENCQEMTFHAEQIGDIEIGNIHSQINRPAINAITKYTECDEFAIEVLSVANHKMGIRENSPTAFDFCKGYRTIVSVVITYEDGSHENIYVPYLDVSQTDGANQYETACIAGNGNLYISCSADRDACDICGVPRCLCDF